MSKWEAQACSSVLVWKFGIVLLQHGQMLLFLCPKEQVNSVQASYFHTSGFLLLMQKKYSITDAFLPNDVL